jgi:hypothetical protein
MYTKFGYSIYREVIGYYMGEENAYGTLMASSVCCEIKNAQHANYAMNGTHSFLGAIRKITCMYMRRHEKGTFARCAQEINHPITASCSSRRI